METFLARPNANSQQTRVEARIGTVLMIGIIGWLNEAACINFTLKHTGPGILRIANAKSCHLIKQFKFAWVFVGTL